MLPLKAKKRENYRYPESWKSDNNIYREKAKKKNTKRTDTKNETRRVNAITLQGIKEKSPILL